MVMLIYTVRLARNAITIRLRYEKAATECASTWQEARSKEIAPDPTRDFIGENWWKMPATVFGSLGVAWTVLEWAGMAQVVLDTVK